jgi:hypothetical protein
MSEGFKEGVQDCFVVNPNCATKTQAATTPCGDENCVLYGDRSPFDSSGGVAAP